MSLYFAIWGVFTFFYNSFLCKLTKTDIKTWHAFCEHYIYKHAEQERKNFSTLKL